MEKLTFDEFVKAAMDFNGIELEPILADSFLDIYTLDLYAQAWQTNDEEEKVLVEGNVNLSMEEYFSIGPGYKIPFDERSKNYEECLNDDRYEENGDGYAPIYWIEGNPSEPEAHKIWEALYEDYCSNFEAGDYE